MSLLRSFPSLASVTYAPSGVNAPAGHDPSTWRLYTVSGPYLKNRNRGLMPAAPAGM